MVCENLLFCYPGQGSMARFWNEISLLRAVLVRIDLETEEKVLI